MFLDLTVVYFAFGAPVGVYEITRRKRSPEDSPLAAVHFILWPLFAAASLRAVICRRAAGTAIGTEESTISEPNLRPRSLTDETAMTFSNFVIFSLDTQAWRYIGRTDGTGTNELFKVGYHPDADLASRCLDRRNRSRLEFHLLNARNEFDALISKLAVTDPRRA